MINYLKNQYQYRKYKKVIFIDSENVGYKIPIDCPDNILVILFVRSRQVYENVVFYSLLKNVQIVYLEDIDAKIHNKANLMDFCLIIKLGEMLNVIKNKEIIILSKDGGYDASIEYLRQENNSLNIKRIALGFSDYLTMSSNQKQMPESTPINTQPHPSNPQNSQHPQTSINNLVIPKWLQSQLRKETRDAIEMCNSMNELKKHISKGQNKAFTYACYYIPIVNVQICCRYDVYSSHYNIEVPGHYNYGCPTEKEAIEEMKRLKKYLCQWAQKYHSRQYYKMAKEL